MLEINEAENLLNAFRRTIRRSRRILQRSRINFVKQVIRPKLLYGAEVWGMRIPKFIRKVIEKFDRRAMIQCLGTYRTTSTEDLLCCYDSISIPEQLEILYDPVYTPVNLRRINVAAMTNWKESIPSQISKRNYEA